MVVEVMDTWPEIVLKVRFYLKKRARAIEVEVHATIAGKGVTLSVNAQKIDRRRRRDIEEETTILRVSATIVMKLDILRESALVHNLAYRQMM